MTTDVLKSIDISPTVVLKSSKTTVDKSTESRLTLSAVSDAPTALFSQLSKTASSNQASTSTAPRTVSPSTRSTVSDASTALFIQLSKASSSNQVSSSTAPKTAAATTVSPLTLSTVSDTSTSLFSQLSKKTISSQVSSLTAGPTSPRTASATTMSLSTSSKTSGSSISSTTRSAYTSGTTGAKFSSSTSTTDASTSSGPVMKTTGTNLSSSTGLSLTTPSSRSSSVSNTSTTGQNNTTVNTLGHGNFTVSPSAGTTSNGTLTYCTVPTPPVNGVILSAGPYVANVSSVVFSCLSGFTINGNSQVVCGTGGTWASTFPQCVPENIIRKVDNNISLGDETVPLWLTVILCVVFGLVCLLLVACFLAYCLKIFGYRKRPQLGQKIGSTDEIYVSNNYRNARMTDRNSRTRDDPGRRSGSSNGEIRDVPRHHIGKTVQTGHFDSSRTDVNRNTSNIYHWENETAPTADKRLYRREAKMPAKKTWMPHSHRIRNINTSTK